jgi:pimeloyl-ACP methyl ester carboxylesterase
MNLRTASLATVLLAAAVSSLPASANAQWRGWGWGGFGVGLAAGAIIGGALAAPYYSYGYAPGYSYGPRFLAVWGRNDPFFLPRGAEAFRRDVPGAIVHFFDTGHFALETHAREIAAEIRDFFAH